MDKKPASESTVSEPAPPESEVPTVADSTVDVSGSTESTAVAEETEVESAPVVSEEATALEVSQPAEPAVEIETEDAEVAENTNVSDAPMVEASEAASEPAVEAAAEQSLETSPAVTDEPAAADPAAADPAAAAADEPAASNEYVNPIDVQSEAIAGLLDLEKAGYTLQQATEICEDTLPPIVALTCLRNGANDPQQFGPFVKELSDSNNHALRNLVSRKIRKHAGRGYSVNRQQSLMLADAIIQQALVVTVEEVAACYAAVEVGSFTEE